jgi:hypothetical protein
MNVCLLLILIIPQVAFARFDSDAFSTLFIALIVLVLIFLAIREVLCWYWKINTIVGLLEDIRRKLNAQLSGDAIGPNPSAAEITICPACQAQYIGDLRGKFCESCGTKLE